MGFPPRLMENKSSLPETPPSVCAPCGSSSPIEGSHWPERRKSRPPWPHSPPVGAAGRVLPPARTGRRTEQQNPCYPPGMKQQQTPTHMNTKCDAHTNTKIDQRLENYLTCSEDIDRLLKHCVSVLLQEATALILNLTFEYTQNI